VPIGAAFFITTELLMARQSRAIGNQVLNHFKIAKRRF